MYETRYPRRRKQKEGKEKKKETKGRKQLKTCKGKPGANEVKMKELNKLY